MKQILIIDDNSLYRRLAIRYLNDNAYEIHEAQDGRSGLKKISDAQNNSSQYSLILLDINMPGMDGFQVVDRLVQQNISTPVIIVSGSLQEEIMTGFKHSDRVDFVEKPFDEHGFKCLMDMIKQKLCIQSAEVYE